MDTLLIAMMGQQLDESSEPRQLRAGHLSVLPEVRASDFCFTLLPVSPCHLAAQEKSAPYMLPSKEEFVRGSTIMLTGMGQ